LDFALEKLLEQLRQIRRSRPTRPVVLALTCLHDAYPQQQHALPYPFLADGGVEENARPRLPEDLLRSLEAQRRQFEGLCDYVVPLDLTPPEEGFHDP